MPCYTMVQSPFVLFQKDEPDLIDDDDEDDAEDTAAAKDVNDDVIAMDFAVDYLPTHAAWCDESLNSRTDLKECRTDLKECRTELKECRTEMKECRTELKEWRTELKEWRTALKECRTELKECRTELKECRTELKECRTAEGVQDRAEGVQDRAEGVQDRPEGVQDRAEGVQDRAEGVDDGAWRNIADVGMAADHFRQALLVSKEDERNLKVKLDMAEDEEDREGQIINFYKTPNIDWARPFHAKLQGLSPAVLHVLAGGTPQTATIALEDINDIDVRETIGPVYEVCESNNGNLTTLSVEQRDAINKLAVEMAYSILKETNRCWLLHNLLQDAVFGRIKEQLKQIKQGLKETYVLDLLEARPDAITQVFPSEAEATCSPEVVLDFIQWPQEDDGQEPKKIKEFLMQFISTVSQDKLKQLVKFWVGWEIPMTEMKLEVVDSNHYPRASTCFRILRLPSHYQTYDDFRQSLEMCLGTIEFGFGLI
ncbi:unnamed protein product [Boreogadus saida]